MSRKRINKNKTILRKLSQGTIPGYIQWIFIGETIDDNGRTFYIFITSKGVYGSKHVVFELHIFEDPQLNVLIIYLQNYKKMQIKTKIKTINSSGLLKSLCDDVLNNVMEYDDEFIPVYNKLTKSKYTAAIIKNRRN